MVLLKALSAIMVVIATMLGLSEAVCTHPSVRKEWRKLSKAERADWISAVKVSGESARFIARGISSAWRNYPMTTP